MEHSWNTIERKQRPRFWENRTVAIFTKIPSFTLRKFALRAVFLSKDSILFDHINLQNVISVAVSSYRFAPGKILISRRVYEKNTCQFLLFGKTNNRNIWNIYFQSHEGSTKSYWLRLSLCCFLKEYWLSCYGNAMNI